MTRTAVLAGGCILALVVFARTAAGQASVEAATAAAGSATASGTAKSVGGVLNNLDKALKAAVDPTAPKDGIPGPSKAPKDKGKTAAPTAKENLTPAPPAPIYEDPAGIKPGLSYDDVRARFGPPSLEFVTGPATKTLSYRTKDGVVHVECQDGKVTSAEKS